MYADNDHPGFDEIEGRGPPSKHMPPLVMSDSSVIKAGGGLLGWTGWKGSPLGLGALPKKVAQKKCSARNELKWSSKVRK